MQETTRGVVMPPGIKDRGPATAAMRASPSGHHTKANGTWKKTSARTAHGNPTAMDTVITQPATHRVAKIRGAVTRRTGA